MRLVGARVPRVEDSRILSGRGRFIDDIRLPRMLHAAFVRSPSPHARIVGVDACSAREVEGVVAIFTGADLIEVLAPMPMHFAGRTDPIFHALATDRVRFVGDPVAVIIASSRQQAEDAVEQVDVQYDDLDPVTDPVAALSEASPVVFDDLGSNVLTSDESTSGDVDAIFAAADRVVERRFRQHRVAPVPMETRGSIADFDPASGQLLFHANTQSPHGLRMALAGALGMPADRVRVTVPDMGGSFGLKSCFGREDFCIAAASRSLGRPVKWIEDREEHLLASGHARDEVVEIAVAVDEDGVLRGLRAKMVLDQGAYPAVPFPSYIVTAQVESMLPGPYRWDAYAFERTIVITNKCTYVAYRGPWEVETWVRERMLDEVARELDIDPIELRRRNLSHGAPDDRMASGLSLAEVSNRASLEIAVDAIGYDSFRTEQAAARARGRCLGIGVATFIEAAPGPPEMRRGGGPLGGEMATVRLDSSGSLLLYTSQIPHGQGHTTTLAQVVADEMGVPFERVKVVHGDTETTPFKIIGTGGSMAATWGSGAAIAATREVKRKVLDIAAELLEASPDDLYIEDGMITPRGVPARALPLADLAMQATMMPQGLPVGAERALEATERFRGEGITGSGWSGGTHACIVDIDLGTGEVAIRRYVVAEDCGRIINPGIVDGQIRGGVAQGIGEALYEHAAYDEDGNFVTGTFMDYLLPTSAEIPEIEIHHMETSPEGDVGFRGVGEGGAIVAPATVTNAIADALANLGSVVCEQPLHPSRILELAGVIETCR